MLTAKEIISDIAADKEYYSLCKKLSPTLYKDLFQELILILLQYDKNKLISLHEDGRIKFYVIKILMNQACSSTSPFYKKYRKKDISYDEMTSGQYLRDYIEEMDECHYDTKPFINIERAQDYLTHELMDITESTIQLYSAQNDNNWYRAKLFELYMKEGTIRKLSIKTGIPAMSIHRSLKEFKEHIKKLVNENTFSTTI